MNNKRLIVILFIFVFAFFVQGQQNYIQQIAFEDVHVEKKDESLLIIEMNIDLSKLYIERNRQIQLMPVLVAKNNTSLWELPYLLLQGTTRNKVHDRKELFNHRNELEKNAEYVICRKNNTTQKVPYSASITFEDGMRDASLVIYAKATGCADCDIAESKRTIMDRLLHQDFVPVYKLTYIVPEVEEVKSRCAKYTARFNYKVGRHELLHNYKNNAREFEEVDRVINEIKNNKDLTILDLSIAGYASPEGSERSNMELSKRRANAFADYLLQTHCLPENKLRTTWYGEDWEGLKKAVNASSIADKQAIIRIIQEVNNLDARDAHLKKLSGGTTYKKLLNNFYPLLRRNEYTVTYVVRPFDVEEAREIIKTKPHLLSLNEMYLVAQTYPVDSKEFKKAFNIASRIFPDEPIAIVNSAAADIEAGEHASAVERMKRIENNPRVWNNLGVAYARMGDTDNATKYFRKAATNGDVDAIKNEEQLKKAMSN